MLVSGAGSSSAIAGQTGYFYVKTVDQWNNPTTLIEDIDGNVLTQYATDPTTMCTYFSIIFFYGTFDGEQSSPNSVVPTGNLAECLVTYTLAASGDYLNYINEDFAGSDTLALTVYPGKDSTIVSVSGSPGRSLRFWMPKQ